MQQKLISTVGHYIRRMQLGHVFWEVMKTCNACIQAFGLGSIQIALSPLMFYSHGRVMFEVFYSCKEG